MNARIVLLGAAAMLGACSVPDTPGPLTEITGTVTYRERMMPPPGAVLDVVLEDVSQADAPAKEMMRTLERITTAPPYRISLWVDPTQIIANHRYNVRAKITVGSQLLFHADTASPVFGPNNILQTDIVLRRTSAADARPTPPSQQLRGMYSYMADAGWFVDCLSGVRMPVAQEGDNAALEQSYSTAKAMAGAPMLATVQGRVEKLMPMEGDGPRPTLIVDRFISVEAQGCSGRSSTAELENTYWKLMTLDGIASETPAGAREIHFVLHHEGLRMAGFSGCNGITGTYRLEGDRIKFADLAGTLMACPNTLDVERRIHEMFSNVTGWKISGETLLLTNAGGEPVATFESRYMR